jgi:hypothetical protein
VTNDTFIKMKAQSVPYGLAGIMINFTFDDIVVNTTTGSDSPYYMFNLSSLPYSDGNVSFSSPFLPPHLEPAVMEVFIW